ncbi:MAG: hypothetical protein ACM31D_10965 [Bacteroidota bacterium]
MPNRIVAVTAVALALGLAACDKGGQEQAQTPSRGRDQQQSAPPASPPPSNTTTPSQPATPPEQAPTTPPPGGTGSGSQ